MSHAAARTPDDDWRGWSAGRAVEPDRTCTTSTVLLLRVAELEGRKSRLQADLATAEATDGHDLRIHPGLIERYREQVAQLEDALLDEAIRGEAEEASRALVERVVLTPDDAAPDRLAAEVHGDLAVILRLGDGSLKTRTPPGEGRRTGVLGSQVSLDAGTRIGLSRTTVR